MGANTSIQWAHHTFNPWRGCARVSPGCDHCYAEAMSRRNPAVLGTWGEGGSRPVAAEAYWRQPVRWCDEARMARRNSRVFCASLADVFEDRRDLDCHRERLFRLAYRTRTLVGGGLKWMFLTKRPQSIMPLLRLARHEHPPNQTWGEILDRDGQPPLPSWWFGTTVEDQRRADERLPHLLAVKAELRFLSCEPLLEPVDLTPWLRGGIGWVIVGGESSQGGARARDCDLDAVDSLVGQCRDAKVPVFVKQLGSRPVAPGLGLLRLKDRHGGEPEEWPDGMRVREVPQDN